MYITPVSMNYSRPNTYRQNRTVSQPAFKGGLSEAQIQKIVAKIAERNTEVFENFSMPKLKTIMDTLTRKYEYLGVRSCGIQIVDNEYLPKLLGKDFSKYDTNGKIGLSVVVGNKYGPVEEMTRIYEAKTFLANPEAFK